MSPRHIAEEIIHENTISTKQCYQDTSKADDNKLLTTIKSKSRLC